MPDEDVVIESVEVRFGVRGLAHGKPFCYDMGERAFAEFIAQGQAALERVAANRAEECQEHRPPDRQCDICSRTVTYPEMVYFCVDGKARCPECNVPYTAEWRRREHTQIQQVGQAPAREWGCVVCGGKFAAAIDTAACPKCKDTLDSALHERSGY